jgi:hypothetical protein
LADAMRHRCERVSEEARLTQLLNDLNGNLIDDKIGDGGLTGSGCGYQVG